MTNKIYPKDLHRIFFYLFLFAIPLQGRKVFMTSFSFYAGSFIEYGGVFLYLSDVLLLLALASFFVFNRNTIKSSLFELRSKSSKPARRLAYASMLVLVIVFFASTLFNQKYLVICLFRSCKLVEMILLALYISLNFREKNFLLSSLRVIVMAGFFQSLVAIYQFFYQKSLFTPIFLHKLTGESILSPDLPGIAKVVSSKGLLIRSYGTFPHPNLLGGFLVLSLFISCFLHFRYKREMLPSIHSHYDTIVHFCQVILPRMFWLLIFAVQLLALFFSFSRSAWLGLIIGAAFFAVASLILNKSVSRETIWKAFSHDYQELSLSAVLMIVIVAANAQLVTERTLQDLPQDFAKTNDTTQLPDNSSFGDRFFFNDVSRETFYEHPLLGSGPGTATFQISHYSRLTNSDLEPWQLQPAHNIFMLSLSETGIFGFISLLILLCSIFSYSLSIIVSRETPAEQHQVQLLITSVIISYLFIGLFDHYFFTLQQGLLCFWTTIGLILIA